MKRIILSTMMLIGISLIANAQTTGDQGSGGTHMATSGAAADSTRGNSSQGKSGKKGKQVTVNQRRMYQSNKTGQSATPTGQQATGVNASNANNPKNAGIKDQQ